MKSTCCALRQGTHVDCFLTSTAPSSLEVYRGNEYHKTADEYVVALAEALRVEYAPRSRAPRIEPTTVAGA